MATRSITDENLIYSLALQAGVPDAVAKNMVAQARHETGEFTSRFYTNGNNAFGYAYVKGAKYQSGPGPIADNSQAIAYYPSVKNSVLEVRDWWLRRMKEHGFTWSQIDTPEEYATRLKQYGYYGDTLSNYKTALVRYWSQLTGLVASRSGSIAVLVIAAIGFFF